MIIKKDKKLVDLETMRHSCAHVLAQAVKRLWPKTKLTIGPAIENGFYYDFDRDVAFTPADFPKIEAEMKKIIKANYPFERIEMSREEAIRLSQKMSEPYKVELIEDLPPEEQIIMYRDGEFLDLCKGPHLKSTGKVGVFKLLRVAGAYWRGDEKNKMLTRIYGTAFATQAELDNYLKILEEAEKRDHRKIGQELDLFSFDEEVGAGLPLWHPKGALLCHLVRRYWREEHQKTGYQFLQSPHIGNLKLWQTSGHWNFYRENMYSAMDIDEEKFLLKPMNCPFHVKIYKTQMRSYRDLPLRWAELGTVYRYERSGVLHGLTRVRGFTQDDAHIICTPQQMAKEIINVARLAIKMLRAFGFREYDIYLSTRPEKYVGSLENWEKATDALAYALKQMKLKYQVDPGEGVFYGPKVDIKIKDTLGRAWQCTTIQVDFNLPERFQMEYIGQDGKKKQPIMIHRALLGSLERFIGVLLEHYAGALPVWLAPVQVVIIPVGKDYYGASRKLGKELQEQGIRCEVDELRETVGYKIRKAERMKVPYMLVIGEKEAKKKTLNVRKRGKAKVESVSRKAFIKQLLAEIDKKH